MTLPPLMNAKWQQFVLQPPEKATGLNVYGENRGEFTAAAGFEGNEHDGYLLLRFHLHKLFKH